MKKVLLSVVMMFFSSVFAVGQDSVFTPAKPKLSRDDFNMIDLSKSQFAQSTQTDSITDFCRKNPAPAGYEWKCDVSGCKLCKIAQLSNDGLPQGCVKQLPPATEGYEWKDDGTGLITQVRKQVPVYQSTPQYQYQAQPQMQYYQMQPSYQYQSSYGGCSSSSG